jgi:predicted RNA binding protein YcfA (HicA-like mRNA interferase family)
MTVLKSREVTNGLLNKGFKAQEGDHRYLVLFVNGVQQRIWTKVSHSNRKDCEEWHIHQMAKQVKLDKTQFIGLVKCPIKYEQYLRILTDKGIQFV